MQYDFADILATVVERNASDLHITPGVAPMLRIRGSLSPIDGLPRLTPTDTREIVYSVLNNSQRQTLETHNQLDFSYAVPGKGRFRVNAYHQRGAVSAAFRLIPSEDGSARGARPAAGHPRASPRSRAAWCWSPARPAPASRRRSPR